MNDVKVERITAPNGSVFEQLTTITQAFIMDTKKGFKMEKLRFDQKVVSGG